MSAGRLAAVAVAPGVALADRDVEQRRAVVAVELAERARADQPVRLADVDAHREAVGAEGPHREEALDLLGAHRAVLVAGQARDLGILVPAHEVAQVVTRVAPEHDERALDVVRKPAPVEHRGNRITARDGVPRPATTATIARMRRWSEVAEQVAATTKTSEKTAILAEYLASLDAEALPIAAVFLTGRAFAEADQRTIGIGWAGITGAVLRVAGADGDALRRAYDRFSDVARGGRRRARGGRPRAAARRRADAGRDPRRVRGDRGRRPAPRRRPSCSRRCSRGRVRGPRRRS